MKTVYTMLILFCATLTGLAQENINYKAIITDDVGNIIQNQMISVRFTVMDGMFERYKELHMLNTDNNGLITCSIGTGVPLLDSFSILRWDYHDYELKVEVDIGNGYLDLGTSPFEAVPYALALKDPVFRFNGTSNAYTTKNVGIGTLDVSRNLNVSDFDLDGASIAIETDTPSKPVALEFLNGGGTLEHYNYKIENVDSDLNIAIDSGNSGYFDIFSLNRFGDLTLNGGLRLSGGLYVTSFSDNENLNSTGVAIPTENAVKTYVDTEISELNLEHPFETNGNNVYKVNGNVGIGTNNPLSKLHVIGTVRIGNGAEISGISSSPNLIYTQGTAVPTTASVKTYVDDKVEDLENSSKVIVIPNTAFVARGGNAIYNLNETHIENSSSGLIAPVTLPVGAEIYRIDYQFKDNSNSNLTAYLYAASTNSGSYTGGSCIESTTGSSSSSISRACTEAITISSSNQYSISVYPSASGWDGDNLGIISVRIYYR